MDQTNGSLEQPPSANDPRTPPAESEGRVLCPHCWQLVLAEATNDDSVTRCPLCAGVLGAAGQREVDQIKYAVHTPETRSHQSKEIQEYVQSLEAHARKEQAKQPYHRRRFPIDLLVGLILVCCGCWLLITAFSGEGGLMSTLVNTIFPAFVLILIGAVCLIFWAK
jgi:hypothetical protein